MALASRGWNMVSTQDEMIAELRRANAELRQERDAALAENAVHVEALSRRDSDFEKPHSSTCGTTPIFSPNSSSAR